MKSWYMKRPGDRRGDTPYKANDFPDHSGKTRCSVADCDGVEDVKVLKLVIQSLENKPEDIFGLWLEA